MAEAQVAQANHETHGVIIHGRSTCCQQGVELQQYSCMLVLLRCIREAQKNGREQRKHEV